MSKETIIEKIETLRKWRRQGIIKIPTAFRSDSEILCEAKIEQKERPEGSPYFQIV